MSAETPVTAEEFAGYFRPREALQALPNDWDDQIKIKNLVTRLSAAMLVGIAEYAHLPKETRRYFVLPKGIWASWSYTHEPEFWQTGDCQFMQTASTGYGAVASSLSAFNIRFDPLGISAISAQVAAPAAMEQRPAADAPIVSQADLSRWHEVFKGVHPQGSEELALRSAAAMFPDKRVPRQMIRDLRGAQPIGRPTTRQK